MVKTYHLPRMPFRIDFQPLGLNLGGSYAECSNWRMESSLHPFGKNARSSKSLPCFPRDQRMRVSSVILRLATHQEVATGNQNSLGQGYDSEMPRSCFQLRKGHRMARIYCMWLNTYLVTKPDSRRKNDLVVVHSGWARAPNRTTCSQRLRVLWRALAGLASCHACRRT